MDELILFGGSIALSFLAWGAVCRRYAWRPLSRMGFSEAVRPLLLLHAFRFVGLAFVVPGMVTPALQSGFAVPAAYGDLGAVLLAWAAMLALGTRWERPAVWAFSLWGCADLLLALYLGLFGVGISPSALGAAYLIPTVLVPLLFITHAMILTLLLRRGHPALAADAA